MRLLWTTAALRKAVLAAHCPNKNPFFIRHRSKKHLDLSAAPAGVPDDLQPVSGFTDKKHISPEGGIKMQEILNVMNVEKYYGSRRIVKTFRAGAWRWRKEKAAGPAALAAWHEGREITSINRRQFLLTFLFPAVPALAVGSGLILMGVEKIDSEGLSLFSNAGWIWQCIAAAWILFGILYGIYYAAVCGSFTAQPARTADQTSQVLFSKYIR